MTIQVPTLRGKKNSTSFTAPEKLRLYTRRSTE